MPVMGVSPSDIILMVNQGVLFVYCKGAVTW